MIKHLDSAGSVLDDLPIHLPSHVAKALWAADPKGEEYPNVRYWLSRQPPFMNLEETDWLVEGDLSDDKVVSNDPEADSSRDKQIRDFVYKTALYTFKQRDCLKFLDMLDWTKLPSRQAQVARLLVVLHPECNPWLSELPFKKTLVKADESPEKVATLANKWGNVNTAVELYVWGLGIKLRAGDVAWLALQLEPGLFEEFCNVLAERPWRAAFLWERVREVLRRFPAGATKGIAAVDKCALRVKDGVGSVNKIK